MDLVAFIRKLLCLKTVRNRLRRVNGKTVFTPVIGNTRMSPGDEPWMTQLLSEMFRSREGAFIDVGVNLGQTLVEVKTLDPGRPYYGFEPNPHCVTYVRQLAELNDWQCRLFPVGLSDRNGVVEFLLRNNEPVDPEASIVPAMRKETAQLQTAYAGVFQFSELEKHIQSKPGIVKVDVEGAEWEVLKGMREFISRVQPYLILEILSSNQGGSIDDARLQRQTTLVSLLESLKYQLYRIETSPDEPYRGLKKIDDPKLVFESPNANYAAFSESMERQPEDSFTIDNR